MFLLVDSLTKLCCTFKILSFFKFWITSWHIYSHRVLDSSTLYTASLSPSWLFLYPCLRSPPSNLRTDDVNEGCLEIYFFFRGNRCGNNKWSKKSILLTLECFQLTHRFQYVLNPPCYRSGQKKGVVIPTEMSLVSSIRSCSERTRYPVTKEVRWDDESCRFLLF